MDKLDLQIYANTSALPQIDTNFDELKEQLIVGLADYNALIVSEDGVKEGKKARAELNGLRKQVEAERIAIKKAYNEPVLAFEKQVKELVVLIDEPIKAIDEQIKVFEDSERENKLAQIKEIYEAEIGDVSELLPFEKLFVSTWLNKTVSLKKITEELKTKIDSCKANIEMIQAIADESKDRVLATYIRTLDLNVAMQEREKYQQEQVALKLVKPEAKQEAPSNLPTAEVFQADLDNVEPMYMQLGLVLTIKNSEKQEKIKLLSDFLQVNNFEFRLEQK